MPSAQNIFRLKSTFQSCEQTLKSKEAQNFASGLCGIDNLPSGTSTRAIYRTNQSHKCSEEQNITRGKVLSMSQAISRAISIPSVHGPSWQACEYYAQQPFLVNKNASYLPNDIRVSDRGRVCTSMKTFSFAGKGFQRSFSSSSRTGNGLNFRSSCSLRDFSDVPKTEKKNSIVNSAHAFFALNLCNSGMFCNWILGLRKNGFPNVFASLSTARATPEITFEGSPKDENSEENANGSEQIFLGDRTLKLLSGSCYLPHPEKEETGGEDAHFICTDEQAIGVADGVGGWALQGVNAGEYARELMAKSADAIQEEPKGSVDLLRVLEKAYMKTKARGSSTACILALTEKGLHAINLGDSGFLVVRDGCTVFKSPVQQHDFNFTYQLECGDGSDLPSSAQVFNLQVAPGDVIIAGTDGLFDNLYNSEITGVVVHAVRAGLGPQVTAQKIAALARQRALDTHRQTPFSTAAQDAGFRYYGGKLDDITVVVSYVSSSSVI